MELAGLTIHALHDKLVSGEVSATVNRTALTGALSVQRASKPRQRSKSGAGRASGRGRRISHVTV